jgi:spermidine synthase
LLAVLLIPLPVYHRGQDAGSVLLDQSEGYYQTIRVFTDNSTYMRMDLGPNFHAKMSLADQEPILGYAVEMIKQAGDVKGKKILIIGGAGHTQAHALEKRGATVTEVEIDPFVIRLSDRYFGKINGRVVATDGRAYLEQLKGQKFDLIFVDAFDGLASAPVQLTTGEFFEAASRALNPGGRLIYNFIGVQSGPGSNSYRALSETMASVFADSRAALLGEGGGLTNLILIASQVAMNDVQYPPAPRGGTLLTDDLNPVEIFFEQARADYYFR